MGGLVLEGGGARGSYHIGAYKAMQEKGLEFQAVAGASIGAINGAMIAQGDWDKAYQVWYDISLSKVFDIKEEYLKALHRFELKPDRLEYFLAKFQDILNNRGLDTTKMKGILRDIIDEAKIRRTGVLLGIVTVSLTDRKPLEIFLEDIPEGQLVDYLMASASLPIFKLEKIGDKVFLDGGFYDNLPVSLLYSRGYRDLVAVRTHGLGRVRKITAPDLRLTTIEPRDDLGNILNFSQEGVRRNLLLGYFDTRRVLDGLRGNEYYLETCPDKEYFVKFFLGLGEEAIRAGAQILGLKEMPLERLIFDSLIPRILELAGLKTENVCEDACLALCEAVAKKYGIQRFKIYTFSEFFQQIALKHKETARDAMLKEKGVNLLIYNPFLLRKRREELLEKAALAILDQALRNAA